MGNPHVPCLDHRLNHKKEPRWYPRSKWQRAKRSGRCQRGSWDLPPEMIEMSTRIHQSKIESSPSKNEGWTWFNHEQHELNDEDPRIKTGDTSGDLSIMGKQQQWRVDYQPFHGNLDDQNKDFMGIQGEYLINNFYMYLSRKWMKIPQGMAILIDKTKIKTIFFFIFFWGIIFSDTPTWFDKRNRSIEYCWC